jgi:hypothetical protein
LRRTGICASGDGDAKIKHEKGAPAKSGARWTAQSPGEREPQERCESSQRCDSRSRPRAPRGLKPLDLNAKDVTRRRQPSKADETIRAATLRDATWKKTAELMPRETKAAKPTNHVQNDRANCPSMRMPKAKCRSCTNSFTSMTDLCRRRGSDISRAQPLHRRPQGRRQRRTCSSDRRCNGP